MKESRLPKQLFYGELSIGKRPQHKPRKRYKDCIKNNIKKLAFDINNWEELALDRAGWRGQIRDSCQLFEECRLEHKRLKRRLRMGDNHGLDDDIKGWTCDLCQRILLSKAGWVNHVKSHKEKNALDIPQTQSVTACTLCDKICKTSSGLKRHMMVHMNQTQRCESIKVVASTLFVCHLCDKACKSTAGLASHLRGHARERYKTRSERD